MSKFESLWSKRNEGDYNDQPRGAPKFQIHNVIAGGRASDVFVGRNSIRTALESSVERYRQQESLPPEPQFKEEETKRPSPPPVTITRVTATTNLSGGNGGMSTANVNPVDGSNDDGVDPAVRAASLLALEAGRVARAKLRASMGGSSTNTTRGFDDGAAAAGRSLTTANSAEFMLTQDSNRSDHAFDYGDDRYGGPLPSDEDEAMPSR